MKILPFVHEGLGNSSYLVEIGGGEALLVDPNRVVDPYLRAAEERSLTIRRVIETHVHADFVSGARDIAHETGAEIWSPEGGEYRFDRRPVKAGERFGAGALEIEAVPSPGHTPEHLSYVARVDGEEPVLFSGGSLIVGGAARTDLISQDMTERQTHWLFDTLQNAFAALPDETLLYPTHGSGSFCSATPGAARTSTLGEERAHNGALAVKDEDEFVRWFPTTFPAIPAYYARMRAMNEAPRLRGEIARPTSLDPTVFDEARGNALVVDARGAERYAVEHIPGVLSIEFRDSFAVWLGWLAPEDANLLFVTDDKPTERLVEESMLVGYEKFAGWLDGGMRAWKEAGLPVESIPLVDAETAKKALMDGALAIDVREPDEYEAGHVPDALHIPLGQISAQIGEVPMERPALVYCGVGERSASAVSLFERAGYKDVLNLKGGYTAWRKAGLPKER
jgi:hydroxyacylglutathione hydrolase